MGMASSVERLYLDEKGLTVDEKIIVRNRCRNGYAMKAPRLNSNAMRDREFDARPACIYNAPTPDLRSDLIDTAVKFIRKNQYMASSVERRAYPDEKGLTADEKIIVRNRCRNM